MLIFNPGPGIARRYFGQQRGVAEVILVYPKWDWAEVHSIPRFRL